MSLPTAVYVLCFLTALACAVLLLRAYRATGSKLLLWTGLGFSALTVNNLLLVADLVVWPDGDLWVLRQAAAVTAIAVFLYGFLWELDG